jgi:hypothetical protein
MGTFQLLCISFQKLNISGLNACEEYHGQWEKSTNAGDRLSQNFSLT